MIRTHLIPMLLAGAALAPAGEVYLNTLDSGDRVLVERQQGPYVGLWLGAATGGRASFDGKLQGSRLESETGFTGGIKAGYYWRLPFAVRPALELDLGYLNDDFGLSGSANSDSGKGRVSGGGDIQALVGTVNFVLALDLGAYRDQVGDFFAALHPYVGIGAGGAYSSLDGFDVSARTNEGKKRVRVDGGSSFDFAHQFLAGLEIELEDDFSIFGEWKRINISNTGSTAVRDYERALWTFGAKFGY
jgi:hypothetical protein